MPNGMHVFSRRGHAILYEPQSTCIHVHTHTLCQQIYGTSTNCLVIIYTIGTRCHLRNKDSCGCNLSLYYVSSRFLQFLFYVIFCQGVKRIFLIE